MDQVKKMFLFLFVGLFVTVAEGQQSSLNWKAATVKVISSPCLTGSPRFEGSGLLFHEQGRYFVVTSEHVLIQDSSARICHMISNEKIEAGEHARVQLIRADYFHGLALLELSSSAPISKFAIPMEALQSPAAVQGTSLTALGYPAASLQLAVQDQGQLTSARSLRALIPGVKEMIEADGLMVEFGMSGGLLLAGKQPLFAGLITHQYLKREAGHPTSVGEINEESSLLPGDLAFAIPAPQVVEWIQATLAGLGGSDWIRRSQSQLQGIEEVCFQVLCFSMKQKKASDILGVGGTGGDGAGVGGDGAGVGGDGALSSSSESLMIVSVRLDLDSTAEERQQVYADLLLEKFRLALLQGQFQKHEIFIGFLKRPMSPRLIAVGSLEKFLTLWKRDGLSVVSIQSSTTHLSQDLQKLILLARSVARLAQEQKDEVTDTDQKVWFNFLRDEALLVENSLSDTQIVAALLSGDNDPYWGEFYQRNFDAAVRLEAQIQALLTQMRKMGLN